MGSLSELLRAKNPSRYAFSVPIRANDDDLIC